LAEDVATEVVPDLEAGSRSLRAGLLFGLAVLWLAAEMWSAGASLAANTDLSVVVSTLLLVLPAILGACVLTGAAAGLGATQLAGTRTADRLGRLGRFLTAGAARTGRPAVIHRLIIGGVAGLLVGLVVGGVVLTVFGATSAFVVLGLTLTVAGLLGGAAAALPPAPFAAGIAAALAVFASAVVLSLFQSPLRTLLGGGSSPDSQISAGGWLAVIYALVQGIVAGLTAFTFLRRRGSGQAWPWYLLAGATPGLLDLVTVLVANIGGASLTRLASGFSELDAFSLTYVTQGYLTGALIVTFVGGIAAMIAVGRTMGRASGE
jgi:hypothetical protein